MYCRVCLCALSRFVSCHGIPPPIRNERERERVYSTDSDADTDNNRTEVEVSKRDRTWNKMRFLNQRTEPKRPRYFSRYFILSLFCSVLSLCTVSKAEKAVGNTNLFSSEYEITRIKWRKGRNDIHSINERERERVRTYNKY